ncbi:hypothetical protein SK128_004429, partial [Halocaridina rubra]
LLESAAAIQPVSKDNDIVLVTDEQGHQHVVTINDIVSSLGHLDEKTLTNLLLSPSSAPSSRSSLTNANFNLDVAESQAVQSIAPVVLGTQKVGQIGVERPTRHTGPASQIEDDDDVYVVQDENGEIRIVTINDIISSLAIHNDDSLNKLLFEDTPIPAVAPVILNQVPSTTPRPTTTSTSIPIPPVVTEKNATQNNTSKTPSPTVTTDFNGNIRVLAHPGSVTLDLKDSSWHTGELKVEEEEKETEPEQQKRPVVIDGSTIARDENGNIHITPDPSKPFTLDIQNIIALAEQAEGSNTANKPASNKNTKSQEKEDSDKKDKENVPKGYEILSYLAGVDEFLPAAILPDPIRSQSSNAQRAQGAVDPAGVNSFRTSLIQAIAQQNQLQHTTTPQPVQQPLLQRLVQPVVQPIVQAVSQPLEQSSTNSGIGATFSRVLSNLLGQAPAQTVTITQPQEASPQEEYVKLVVRQQAPNSQDTHFGEIAIPLPKPIHFQPTPSPVQSTEATATQISSRRDALSPLSSLSPAIRRNLIKQVANIPKFVPPKVASRRSLVTAPSGTDSGPVIRTDRNIANTHRNRIPISPPIKPYTANSNPIIRIVTPPPTTTTPKPIRSVSEILTGLPKTVVDSIRKQLQNARIGSSHESETPKPEVKKEEVTTPNPVPNEPLDRIYAHSPSYSGGSSGYGSSHGIGGYGSSHGTSGNPLFDLYFLADLTKVHKVGDTNLSFKSPIIGDPSYFVDTRPHYGHYR